MAAAVVSVADATPSFGGHPGTAGVIITCTATAYTSAGITVALTALGLPNEWAEYPTTVMGISTNGRTAYARKTATDWNWLVDINDSGGTEFPDGNLTDVLHFRVVIPGRKQY